MKMAKASERDIDAKLRALNVARLHARKIDVCQQDRLAAWQPIATAPRDGSRVLICTPDSDRQKVLEAYWATPWEGAPNHQCWWSTPHGPAGRGYTILQQAVTHWMPLPAGPDAMLPRPPAPSGHVLLSE